MHRSAIDLWKQSTTVEACRYSQTQRGSSGHPCPGHRRSLSTIHASAALFRGPQSCHRRSLGCDNPRSPGATGWPWIRSPPRTDEKCTRYRRHLRCRMRPNCRCMWASRCRGVLGCSADTRPLSWTGLTTSGSVADMIVFVLMIAGLHVTPTFDGQDYTRKGKEGQPFPRAPWGD